MQPEVVHDDILVGEMVHSDSVLLELFICNVFPPLLALPLWLFVLVTTLGVLHIGNLTAEALLALADLADLQLLIAENLANGESTHNNGELIVLRTRSRVSGDILFVLILVNAGRTSVRVIFELLACSCWTCLWACGGKAMV